ncbi:cilium assembly protein DZIP1 [Bicyclus anynana]|uniref:Cilium assembly protein DZIP1 n=1 Tax=Bicyclus anynana TaxID=110368 RepID=A0A6J1NAT2_BICAN|nr:cilium assembly protein DZIP1 [Bicyclus anynana]
MACKTSFELHHNFPKLAEESGFTFNTHRPRVHINWNKIKLIDIDNVVRDRKFGLVEEHVNDILDCVLESEFDVRILDEGVLKLFRLAQLAVEYQQFCRHYLDRSVFILKEEITNLLQSLDATKKSLREKEEENRKFKRKSKHSVRTPLPYGNENIAAMILKTLNQNKGELFASTSQIDSLQYNKCNYCEKVFLNQLYLKSHISRRHANILEVPQRDTPDEEANDSRNTKLASEVDELKAKLKQMEELIANKYNSNTQTVVHEASQLDSGAKNGGNSDNHCKKEMKDAEVSTNEDEYILDKIQEWKKEEHEKYNEELSSLRKQIIEIISAKEKQDNTSAQHDLKMMDQLHATIKQQGNEILSLKQELIKEEGNEKEKRKKIEEQMEFWVKRAEVQSSEYKSLLQKLNDVATEAQEFRLKANTEKERANQLEKMLQNHLSKTSPKHTDTENKQKATPTKHNKESHSRRELKTSKDSQTKPTANEITLKKLQQKAQELLNIEQTTTSDSSSISDDKIEKESPKKESNYDDMVKKKMKNEKVNEDIIKLKPRTSLRASDNVESADNKYIEKKQSSNRKPKPTINKTSKKGNGYVYVPGSPIKIVRAKITEEVNQRLISLGVDPLSSKLPQQVFHKQRKLLQEQQEYKSKKWPSRSKVLHSIICHLDQHTSNTNSIQRSDYLPSNNPRKTFSIASVLSNVKTKALSLVKSNEPTYKPYKPYDDVAKKAMALLKTPPGSAHSSPLLLHRKSVNSPQEREVLKTKNKYLSPKIKTKKPIETESSNESYSDNDDAINHKESSMNVKTVTTPVHHSIRNDDRRNSTNKKRNENGSKPEAINVSTKTFIENKDKDNSSDEKESIVDISPRKFLSEENLSNLKQTKGVLKNASSTSSLNKKKVLFDMDAIQMKSLSASPSQSITDKSDTNRKNESGIINLDTEEWDISSIENEPTGTKINRISSHTSPKIAELRQTIESKLIRRNPTLSTTLVGGVDVLDVPKQKATMQSHGGSNTSLGSSILDDTESGPVLDLAVLKPRMAFGKDDSEIEISDLTDDKIVRKTF